MRFGVSCKWEDVEWQAPLALIVRDVRLIVLVFVRVLLPEIDDFHERNRFVFCEAIWFDFLPPLAVLFKFPHPCEEGFYMLDPRQML